MKLLKEKLIYIIFGLVLFFITSTFFYFQSTKRPTPSSLPVNSSLPNHPQEGEVYNVVTKEVESELKKDKLIGKLIKTLPFSGELFTLEYNYDNNVFTVKLEKGRQQQANEEFDKFLKQNLIDDKNWLYNLRTEDL